MAATIGALAAFMLCSIPIVWIVMHYKYRDRSTSGITDEEGRQLRELLDIADSMAERIKTLESILDAETPEWREHHGKQ